jgi:hypothetical protein
MSGNPKSPADGDGFLLFVDAIEAGHARLMLGQEAFDVPQRLLPRGTREGAWVRIALTTAPAPRDDAAAIRAKLGADDDGGDIKL